MSSQTLGHIYVGSWDRCSEPVSSHGQSQTYALIFVSLCNVTVCYLFGAGIHKCKGDDRQPPGFQKDTRPMYRVTLLQSLSRGLLNQPA